MTTDLAPVAPGVLALARKPDFSVSELADALVPAAEPGDEAQPFPALPKHAELTPDVRTALKRVEEVFGSLSLNVRRALTPHELALLTDEVTVLALVKKATEDRIEEAKEIIRVHIDVDGEERGVAVAKGRRGVKPTQRDRKGHYLLALAQQPFVVAVAGFAKGWRQDYKSGGTKTAPTPAEVQALLDGGVIDRPEYLAVTREVRAFDPDKLTAFIRKNPERGLAILRELTSREEPNSALSLPER